eukprot:CAMPEP_0117458158 /NCGR_PEP_ID=MMETSP0784-20121206/783_1 /TAXON_ID=39447 /ORGANISM="" /LENGTH=775 /DNA_ID=CAMNT_0005251661 /DNA_START=77 /DNA_END=2404 /DNA_ORIENTATION=-
MVSPGTTALSFWDLLRRLGEQHERELRSLRERLEGHSTVRCLADRAAPANNPSQYACVAQHGATADEHSPRFTVATSSQQLALARRGVPSHRPGVADSDDEGRNVFSPRHENGPTTPTRQHSPAALRASMSRTESWERRVSAQPYQDGVGTLSCKLRQLVNMDEDISEVHGSDSFALRSDWRNVEHRPMVVTNLLSEGTGAASRSYNPSSHLAEGSFRCLYSAPGSLRRTIWDVATVAALMYDVVMMPMAAFSLEDYQFTRAMIWVIQFFWSADMVANFFVGYYHRGLLVMQPNDIAKHYLQGWFAFDVIIVGVDWLMFALGDGENSSASIIKLLKTGRLMRFFRSLRLLRLAKIQQFLVNLQQHLYSESSNAVWSVVKIFFRILVLSHVVACGWWAVGILGDAESTGAWIEEFSLVTETIEYRYATSLYWTLVQLGFGSTSIEPTNLLERLYAIVVLFFGIIIFSSSVGTLTNVLASLDKMREHESRQLRQFHQFCSQNMISKELRGRISHFIENEFTQRSFRIDDKDVEIFQLLSKPLKAEIQYERYVPCLREHSLFRRLLQIRSADTFNFNRRGLSSVVQRICADVIALVSLGNEDVLFCFGDAADRAYVVIMGRLEYAQRNKSTPVEAGDWVSEAVFWVPWVHLGELQSKTPSQLLVFEAASLTKVICAHHESWLATKGYAELFVKRLTTLTAEQLSDLGEGSSIPIEDPENQLAQAASPQLVLAETPADDDAAQADKPLLIRARFFPRRRRFAMAVPVSREGVKQPESDF